MPLCPVCLAWAVHECSACAQVLAVSDVVIFRTRAERLHSSMFAFLGEASKNWRNHFECHLRKICREFEKGEKLDESRSYASAALSASSTSGISSVSDEPSASQSAAASASTSTSASAGERQRSASALSASVTMSMLGPALIVFHETTHVETLDFSALLFHMLFASTRAVQCHA